MDIIISNKKKKERKYLLSNVTLDNKYIYVDMSNTKPKDKLNNYLLYSFCKYVDNKNFDINNNIELHYSGLSIDNKYVNVSEIFLDEKDLYIENWLYIIMIIKSTITNESEIKNVIENELFTKTNDDSIEVNEIMDVNDNRMKIYNMQVSNVIKIDNVIYDLY